MVKIKVFYWWGFQHRTESICGGSLADRFHCWRVRLALLKHFIVSIVVIRRGSKPSMAKAIVIDLLSWTLCLVLWQDGNWPKLLNGRHLILVKADQKGCPFYSSRAFCTLGVEVLSCSEIKEKNPSSRLWIWWFFSKEIFLLGFSGLLLICNSSEWVKNVFWSHTNMWSQNTGDIQPQRKTGEWGISKWPWDKRGFRSEACISGESIARTMSELWPADISSVTRCSTIWRGCIDPTLLETPKTSHKMPAFI